MKTDWLVRLKVAMALYDKAESLLQDGGKVKYPHRKWVERTAKLRDAYLDIADTAIEAYEKAMKENQDGG